MGDKAGSWRGVAVAISGMVLVAGLGIAAVLAMGSSGTAPTGADVLAALGVVVSPIVAIASAYFGIAVSGDAARKAQEQNERLLAKVPDAT